MLMTCRQVYAHLQKIRIFDTVELSIEVGAQITTSSLSIFNGFPAIIFFEPILFTSNVTSKLCAGQIVLPHPPLRGQLRGQTKTVYDK